MSKEFFTTFHCLDDIGVISLSGSPGNIIPQPAFVEPELFDEWTSRPGLKALIIRGEGRNFSSGGDPSLILQLSARGNDLERSLEAGHRLLNRIEDLDIPVIAAINRICFGGGLEIALACHIRVVSANALLAFPEVNHNLVPGMGGTYRLPSLAGQAQAAVTILGGDIVTAADALKMGIVDHVAPADAAFDYALALARKMTSDRPLPLIRSVMKVLNNSRTLPREEAMAEETRLFCLLARDEAERRKNGGD